MEIVLRLPRRTTYADYLAVEQNSDRRHEFLELPTLSSVITVDEIYDRILDRSGQSVLRAR